LVPLSQWQTPNEGATNESNFSAFPGGFRLGTGYSDIGLSGNWWHSTEFSNASALYQTVQSLVSSSNTFDINKNFGLSVRCLKGDIPGSIDSIRCDSVLGAGTLIKDSLASDVTSIVPYSGGNGGSYLSIGIPSVGVNGLVATLQGGNFAIGKGTLTFTISGTPDTSGIAEFPISIGGKSCTIRKVVIATGGGVTDIDGNFYSSIIIGEQEWMQQNLKVAKYRNGDNIPTDLSNVSWFYTTNGAFAIYDNNGTNDSIFGKLYNWFTIEDQRSLCPTGWHIPSDLEWFTLENYLDPTINNPNSTGYYGTDIGGKLKAVTLLWTSPNVGATNSSGFSALPGGTRYNNGEFSDIGGHGGWWSSTEASTTNGWYRYLDSNKTISYRGTNGKQGGLSVRCLKD
jgi:uncharacterized protein (TIGR02145 family)